MCSRFKFCYVALMASPIELFFSCILCAPVYSEPSVLACPILAKIPRVLVIHGEGDGTLDHMKVCHKLSISMHFEISSNTLGHQFY